MLVLGLVLLRHITRIGHLPPRSTLSAAISRPQRVFHYKIDIPFGGQGSTVQVNCRGVLVARVRV